MRFMTVLAVSMVTVCARAWNSVAEMDVDACRALTNESYLLSSTFTNQSSEHLAQKGSTHQDSKYV